MSTDTFLEWDRLKKDWVQERPGIALQLIHVNVRSLKKHWNLLLTYLACIMPSIEILILTETNVTEQECLQFFIRGFQSFSLCRKDRKGGGVLVLVRESWIAERISVSFTEAEVISVSIVKDSEEFLVIALYRPPSNNVPVFLDELSCFLKRHPNKQIIIAGDVNIDLSCPMKSTVTEYLTLIASFGLENHIRDYTREEILGNKLTQSCIDHISSRLFKRESLASVIKEKVADHYFVGLLVSKESQSSDEGTNEVRLVLNNNAVDKQIQSFQWDSLIHVDHLITYQQVIQKLKDIYSNSKRK